MYIPHEHYAHEYAAWATRVYGMLILRLLARTPWQGVLISWISQEFHDRIGWGELSVVRRDDGSQDRRPCGLSGMTTPCSVSRRGYWPYEDWWN